MPNEQTNIHTTDNPALVNLCNAMSRIEPLFQQFMNLGKGAVSNTNHGNQLFQPATSFVLDQDLMICATGYLEILSLVKQCDFNDLRSLEFCKRRIRDDINNCENSFFRVNHKYQAAPAVLPVIAEISKVFSEVKQELCKLGLLDLPKLSSSEVEDRSAQVVQRRDRDEEEADAAQIPPVKMNRKR